MDYNYYPPQSGHPPPPPPPVTNQPPPHGGPQMQHQSAPGGQMMHAPMPPQNIRQAMPPGPPNHHQQQMQPIQQPHQQHLSHHPQQMAPHQQPHPNYQIQPHPHGPTVSHSGSPHPQQHHNHQPTVSGPPSQQPPTQHHIHPQSPHHQGGQPGMNIPPQQQQPMNQMVRPGLGAPVMNHPQAGMQQHPHHQQQNFFSVGPIPQSNTHHYPQQNHPHHQPPHHQQHHHQQPPIMHGPPHMSTPHHISMQHQGIGRNSPHYPNILQTEFRIIELNRRLQCRPISRHPVTPLPTSHYHDEASWWERFASDFFEDDATLTLRSIQDDKPVEYTIGRTLIPRFFRTYFEGGVTDLSINLRNPKEVPHPHPQLITLDCDQAYIITNNIFKHPAIPSSHSVVVHTEGRLILDFVSNNYEQLSIKSWKFYTRGCREYIDRSITTMGLSNSLLVEPVTRQHGLTKSTISYLKMCMIMEPMQDIMFQHKQTKLEPRSCLRKFLFDKYKYKCGEDNRVITNKRRKRKPSAAPLIASNPNAVASLTSTNKKSKTSINNAMNNNNNAMNNNINMMSPSGQPSFSLASQDVMVVGEPSMMGGDFGDDNERMITRLENTQYDPTASTPSNAEESDSINPSAVNDNGLSNNNIEMNIENHTLSPSLQQRQQQQSLQQQQQVPIMSQDHLESADIPEQQQQQRLVLNVQDQPVLEESATTPNTAITSSQIPSSIGSNQVNLMEQSDDGSQISQQHTGSQSSADQQTQQTSSEYNEESVPLEDNKVDQQLQQPKQELQQRQENDEVKINSIVETTNDSNLILGVNNNEHMDNHTNSIQPLNDESNSNSQLTCSTAPATSAIEQQPVDNGLA